MTEVPVPISKIFTSLDDVENHCNFIEMVLPGFLKKLTAIGAAAEHKNEGICDRMTSEEFLKHKDELGKLKFQFDNGGTNTVWINGVKIKVSFTRE